MVRLALYCGALAVSVTTFALSIASLIQPNWITFNTPTSSPLSIRTTYGLFQICSSSHISWSPGSPSKDDSVTCRKFPTRSQDCSSNVGRISLRSTPDVGRRFRVGLAGAERVKRREARKPLGKEKKGQRDDPDEEWTLCDSWLTAGYAVQLSLVFGSVAILSTLVVALGGRAKRESGWRVVSGLMALHSTCLIVATSLIAHEFNTNTRFYVGSRLDKAFIMATTAWAMDVVVVGGLILIGMVGLLHEDTYEPIPSG